MGRKQKLVTWVVRFNQHAFVQILRETLIMLFPVALVGSIVWIIGDNLLAPNGFLANILRVRQWLPQRQFFRALFGDATTITVGWLLMRPSSVPL